MLKLSKKYIIIVLLIAMVFPLSTMAVNGREPACADEFICAPESLFCAMPDGYDENGIPIFFITVPPVCGSNTS